MNLKDRYEKVAFKLYGIVTVAAVDCEEDEAICDEFEAYGVPQIWAASANIGADYLKFDDDETIGKIASFAVKQMENFA